MALHIGAFHQLRHKTIVALHGRQFGFQRARFASGVGQVEITLDVIAINLEGFDALINHGQAFHRHLPRQSRMGFAELLFKWRLSTGKTHNRLAAVAPGCAAANAVGLQHHHLVAALRQFNGRRQSGKPGAYHQHVGIQVPTQRWVHGRALYAGFVITFLVQLGI